MVGNLIALAPLHWQLNAAGERSSSQLLKIRIIGEDEQVAYEL